MKDATRIKIAALVTALFIGLLTAAGLAVRPSHAPHAATAARTHPTQPSVTKPADDDGAGAPKAAGFSELEDE